MKNYINIFPNLTRICRTGWNERIVRLAFIMAAWWCIRPNPMSGGPMSTGIMSVYNAIKMFLPRFLCFDIGRRTCSMVRYWPAADKENDDDKIIERSRNRASSAIPKELARRYTHRTAESTRNVSAAAGGVPCYYCGFAAERFASKSVGQVRKHSTHLRQTQPASSCSPLTAKAEQKKFGNYLRLTECIAPNASHIMCNIKTWNPLHRGHSAGRIVSWFSLVVSQFIPIHPTSAFLLRKTVFVWYAWEYLQFAANRSAKLTPIRAVQCSAYNEMSNAKWT